MDLDSLTKGVVSTEDLANGSVQVSADGSVDSQPSHGFPNDEPPLDSGIIEQKFRELYGNTQESEEGSEEVAEPEEAQEEQEEQEEEEEQPKPKKGKRDAQSRIRELNTQKKEAQAQLEQERRQYQQQLYQMQQQIAQQQSEFQGKLLSLEERRVEMAQAEKSRSELANMSDAERRAYEFRKQLEGDAVKRAKAEVSSELAALKAEIEDVRKWKQGAVEHAKASQRQQQMQGLVSGALDNVVLRGMDPTDTTVLRPVMEEMLTLYSAAYGTAPEELAPQFLKFMDQWATVRNKQIAKSAGNKLKKGQALPKPTHGKPAAAASNNKAPTMEELKKMGFDNHVRYNAAKALGRVR